jgi:3-oxoacyl-[acyl-carrier protein] reductase
VKVAIVTGGASGTGLAVAHELTSRGYALVIVYLEDQRQAEAAIDELLAARGTAVAVRADIADDLDVQQHGRR